MEKLLKVAAHPRYWRDHDSYHWWAWSYQHERSIQNIDPRPRLLPKPRHLAKCSAASPIVPGWTHLEFPDSCLHCWWTDLRRCYLRLSWSTSPILSISSLPITLRKHLLWPYQGPTYNQESFAEGNANHWQQLPKFRLQYWQWRTNFAILR